MTKISENQNKVSISLKKPFKIHTAISKQIYNYHSPKGIKLIARLRVGLSHLCKDKFKHSFQDTLNPIWKCIKILKPHLIIFIAQTIYKKRWLSWIHPSFNNDQEKFIFRFLVFVLFCVVYPLPVAFYNPYILNWNVIIFLLFLGYYWTDVSQVVGNNWSVGWLVGNAVFSETALKIFLIFAWSYGTIKIEKSQSRISENKFLIWRFLRKGLQISPKSDTLIFFSKMALTAFLVLGLQLVLNMTFNLNETYCSENLEIFDLDIVQKLPKLRFLAILSTLHY